MREWNLESIQVVWFVSESLVEAADVLFSKFWGHAPDQTQTNRSVTPATPFLSVASGTTGRNAVRVTVQPNRIDLNITPDESAGLQPGPPVLVAGEKTLNEVVEKVAATQLLSSRATRLSFVISLNRGASSNMEASKYINECIGSILPDDGFQDISFQVNYRKHMLTKKNIEMNRLMRFNTASYFNLLVPVTVQSARLTLPIGVPERFAANLIIDVNTVVGENVFTADEQVLVLKELAEEARRIKVDGSLSALNSENFKM